MNDSDISHLCHVAERNVLRSHLAYAQKIVKQKSVRLKALEEKIMSLELENMDVEHQAPDIEKNRSIVPKIIFSVQNLILPIRLEYNIYVKKEPINVTNGINIFLRLVLAHQKHPKVAQTKDRQYFETALTVYQKKTYLKSQLN
uniref:Uncharacterized protein n=1 Tax=Romanomermis culicivorax TaxID=13658 RepID=A0A915IZZ1_ROMCU